MFYDNIKPRLQRTAEGWCQGKWKGNQRHSAYFNCHYSNAIHTLTDAKKTHFADWLFFKPKSVGNQRKYEHLAELLIAMLTDTAYPNKQQLVSTACVKRPIKLIQINSE